MFSTAGAEMAALLAACEDRAVRVFKLADVTSSSINVRRKNLTRGPVDVAFGASDSQLLVLTKGVAGCATPCCHCNLAHLRSFQHAFAERYHVISCMLQGHLMRRRC